MWQNSCVLFFFIIIVVGFLFIFVFQEALFRWKKSPLLITPLQEWSSGLLFCREGRCFNWSFVSAETTLHFFCCLFFLEGESLQVAIQRTPD